MLSLFIEGKGNYGTMPIPLCGTYIFAAAQAGNMRCRKGQPVFHTGERQHVSTNGSLAPPAVKVSLNTTS